MSVRAFCLSVVKDVEAPDNNETERCMNACTEDASAVQVNALPRVPATEKQSEIYSLLAWGLLVRQVHAHEPASFVGPAPCHIAKCVATSTKD
jgi:hypothetical protein